MRGGCGQKKMKKMRKQKTREEEEEILKMCLLSLGDTSKLLRESLHDEKVYRLVKVHVRECASCIKRPITII